MTQNNRVLLVDDELHITRNLEKVIPWEMLGLEVAGTAKNGVEALDLLEQNKADLILCDIRMPVMDGLELVRRIREQGLDLDVIMLTGYQDFTYTRAAIQFGVKDYVLKPIPYDELTGVIARVMNEQRARRRKAKDEERKIGQMIDMANEKILYDVLMDYTVITSDSLLMAGVEGQIDNPAYTVIVLDLNVGSEDAQDWREWTAKERKMWNYSIISVLRRTLQKTALPHAVIQTRDGEWCVLIQNAGEKLGQEQMAEWTRHLLGAVRQEAAHKLNAGIFARQAALTDLAVAYKTVQRGMQLAVGGDGLAFFGGEKSAAVEPERVMWDTAERLVGGLKRGDPDKVNDELSRLADQMQHAGDIPTERLGAMLHFVALHLMRELKEAGLLPRDQEEVFWRKLDGRFCVKDLMAAIRQASSVGVARSTDKRKHSHRQMGDAKAFIDRNLFRDLSVEEAASFVGLSTSHFSLLFKQTYGETFIEYVTRERMERAKSLLAETALSVSQIAKEVGYAERRYFTKVFMKYTGQNPSEFRTSRQGGQAAENEPGDL